MTIMSSVSRNDIDRKTQTSADRRARALLATERETPELLVAVEGVPKLVWLAVLRMAGLDVVCDIGDAGEVGIGGEDAALVERMPEGATEDATASCGSAVPVWIWSAAAGCAWASKKSCDSSGSSSSSSSSS